MKSFSDIYAELSDKIQPAPMLSDYTTYYAYKNGEVKSFKTNLEALSFSKNVEKVVDDIYYDKVCEYNALISSIRNESHRLIRVEINKLFPNVKSETIDNSIQFARKICAGDVVDDVGYNGSGVTIDAEYELAVDLINFSRG